MGTRRNQSPPKDANEKTSLSTLTGCQTMPERSRQQAAGAEDRAGYTVPLVIVSQSADADNVPTTCVILASPRCVCRCLTEHVWVAPSSLSLGP